MTDPRAVLDDPIARDLMTSDIPARLAYTALDGTPRVVPVAFLADRGTIYIATAVEAPKVAALQAAPAVALTIDTNVHPPHVVLIRGTATVELVHGVPPEFLAATKKLVPAARWAQFEANVLALYDRMALISITPTWAKVLDFETRGPEAVLKLAARRG